MSVVVNVYDSGSRSKPKRQSKVAKAKNKPQSQVKKQVPVKSATTAKVTTRRGRKWFSF